MMRRIVAVVGCGFVALCASAGAAQALTLGTATVGAQSAGLVLNLKRADPSTLSVPASITKLDAWLSPTATTGSQAIEGVVYADETALRYS
jgi:ABC-type transport system substrate-binding protein